MQVTQIQWYRGISQIDWEKLKSGNGNLKIIQVEFLRVGSAHGIRWEMYGKIGGIIFYLPSKELDISHRKSEQISENILETSFQISLLFRKFHSAEGL